MQYFSIGFVIQLSMQPKPYWRYWMHNNMITINGQKMGKSLGNFITLEQFFTGNQDVYKRQSLH